MQAVCSEGNLSIWIGGCATYSTHPVTHHTQVFLTDGSGLSGVSAAVRLPTAGDGGKGSSAERYLLGSWSDRGVLLCTRAGKEGQPGAKEEL